MSDRSRPDDPDTRDDGARTCEHCVAVIDTSEWYPVCTSPGESSGIHAFCDPACRDAWCED